MRNEVTNNLIHLMRNKSFIDDVAFSELFKEIMFQYRGVGWELGEDLEDTSIEVLSITAGGEAEILKLLGKELSLPVKEDNWQIVAGIQPRNWELYFELITSKNKRVDIDASKWFWCATWSEYSVDLMFYVAESELETLGVLEEAINIVIVGELGELNVAQYINTINIAPISSHRSKERKPMKTLRGTFVQHYPECNYKTFLSGY